MNKLTKTYRMLLVVCHAWSVADTSRCSAAAALYCSAAADFAFASWQRDGLREARHEFLGEDTGDLSLDDDMLLEAETWKAEGGDADAALFVANIVLGIVLPWRLEIPMMGLLRLAFLAATGYSMYKAYLGEAFKLPLIGEWAERQSQK